MPSISLRIEHADGTTSTLDAVDGEYTRSLKEQARGEVRVYREDWKGVESSIDERNDKFFIVVGGADEFGGRYDDSQSDGDTVSVRLNSPEIDAADAKPTANNRTYQNQSADTIATDAINDVGTLSIGTINTSPTGLSYSVSHGSQSKVLYDLREMSGIEFRYNPDFTVDVLDRIGADRSVTLGPAEGNIGDDFSKTKDIREEVTHVRVLGGQSGPDQVTAEAVTSSYSGGRPVWKRYPKKEIIDQSRAQEIADTLVAEYDGEPRSIEIECTVFGEDLQLGDRVSVDYPAENINRQLRLVSLTTEITRRGYLLLCTLSNRALTRESRETKRNDDIETHNRGYGGFIDRDQTTSGWNAAGDGTPQTLEVVNWPDDVVEEKTVELTVLGRAWRSPIDPLAHSHSVTVPDHTHSVDVTHPSHGHTVDESRFDHTHGVDITHPSHGHTVDESRFDHTHGVDVTHPSHDHDVSISTTSDDNADFQNIVTSESNTTVTALSDDTVWYTVDSFSTSANTAELVVFCNFYLGPNSSDSSDDIRFRLYNSGTNSYVPDSGGFRHFIVDNNRYRGVHFVEATDVAGDAIEIQAQPVSQGVDLDLIGKVNYLGIGKHTHNVSDSTTSDDQPETTSSETAQTTTDAVTTTSEDALGTTTSETAQTTTDAVTTTSEDALGTTASETTASGGGTTETTTDDVGAGAEVITTFDGNSYYPTDVEIAVDGTVITTLIGDGTQDWQETIDLSGQLTPGRNTITAAPTGQRGEVNLILASELFRRGKTS